MRAELTVPQVFEPGARVRGRSGRVYVLAGVLSEHWHGRTADGESAAICSEADASDLLCVVAPAPRAGQRWVHITDPARRWDVLADGALWSGMSKLLINDRTTVGLARWLLGHGYDYAGIADSAPATLRASEAAPVASPPAPAPWTLTAARRLITETIAAAKSRRTEAFTSAMCSLAETETPHASVIRAVAVALATLEAALPEHGAPAGWQIERARRRAEDAFRSAAQMEFVPVRVWVALGMYVTKRS